MKQKALIVAACVPVLVSTIWGGSKTVNHKDARFYTGNNVTAQVYYDGIKNDEFMCRLDIFSTYNPRLGGQILLSYLGMEYECIKGVEVPLQDGTNRSIRAGNVDGPVAKIIGDKRELIETDPSTYLYESKKLQPDATVNKPLHSEDDNNIIDVIKRVLS